MTDRAIASAPAALRGFARLLLVLCAGTLAVAAIPGLAADPRGTAPADPLLSCELLPLAVGQEWTYKSGPLEVTERVTRHEKVGDEMCARIETVYNGDVVAFEHVAVRKDGVFRVAIAGKPVEPPLQFLKLPATKGTTWSVESVIVGQTVKGDFAISESTVKVGEETLPVVVVEGKDFTAGKNKLAFTYFFAPNVGKVKQIVYANGQESILQLESLPHPVEQPADSVLREL